MANQTKIDETKDVYNGKEMVDVPVIRKNNCWYANFSF